jgi:hypothetical protein
MPLSGADGRFRGIFYFEAAMAELHGVARKRKKMVSTWSVDHPLSPLVLWPDLKLPDKVKLRDATDQFSS